MESPCVSYMSLQNSTALSALYRGTDFSSLSWFEQQWAAWYIWFGNPVFATAVLAFIVHEVSFIEFGRDNINQLFCVISTACLFWS